MSEASALGLALTAVAVAGGGWLLWLRRTWLVVDVVGESMVPTFGSGDRVLVRRGRTEALRVGDVVVFGGPARDGGRPSLRSGAPSLVVKRVAALPGDPLPDTVPGRGRGTTVPPERLVLLGDNAARSTDSRDWGPVSLEGVRGVVVRRIAPRRRRPAAPSPR
ncbi:S26 family signal peptidase [Nocardiopsis sp. NPDC050513]|uniref:S26 family signal peptidase n=1 Tax=Nocardiopsis sp. NPDC050513 TaxID=3364338 RepID=UPI0037B2F249